MTGLPTGTGTPGDWVRPRWKQGVKWIASMVAMFICGVLAKLGWDMVTDEEQKENDNLN